MRSRVPEDERDECHRDEADGETRRRLADYVARELRTDGEVEARAACRPALVTTPFRG